MKRLALVTSLDFVQVQVKADGCYCYAADVDALLRKLTLLAGHKDADVACRLVIEECRREMERKA